MSYDPKLCEAAIPFDAWSDRGQCSRPHRAERNGRRVCTQHARAKYVPVFVNRPDVSVRATVTVRVTRVIRRGDLARMEAEVREGIAKRFAGRTNVEVVESSEGEVVNQTEMRRAETGSVEGTP